MYNKDFYYNTEDFYKAYENNYAEIPFLDYSDWNCPDSYRKDEHHLNQIGATIFTQKLKRDVSAKGSI